MLSSLAANKFPMARFPSIWWCLLLEMIGLFRPAYGILSSTPLLGQQKTYVFIAPGNSRPAWFVKYQESSRHCGRQASGSPLWWRGRCHAEQEERREGWLKFLTAGSILDKDTGEMNMAMVRYRVVFA